MVGLINHCALERAKAQWSLSIINAQRTENKFNISNSKNLKRDFRKISQNFRIMQ